MADPILYGPAYSTYVRTVRLALIEKNVAYKQVEVDFFKGETQEPAHLSRHPWGKVPAFEHDGFMLYETSAIIHYIDEAFPGPKLQPTELRKRARMNQVIGILDSYAYGAMITSIVIQRVVVPMTGGTPDEAMIKAAIPRSEVSLKALEGLIGSQPYLAGDHFTLADCHAVPIFAYFTQTPEGQKLMPGFAQMSRWWKAMEARPSVVATTPKLG